MSHVTAPLRRVCSSVSYEMLLPIKIKRTPFLRLSDAKQLLPTYIRVQLQIAFSFASLDFQEINQAIISRTHATYWPVSFFVCFIIYVTLLVYPINCLRIHYTRTDLYNLNLWYLTSKFSVFSMFLTEYFPVQTIHYAQYAHEIMTHIRLIFFMATV
jgi:hypothetical protein